MSTRQSRWSWRCGELVSCEAFMPFSQSKAHFSQFSICHEPHLVKLEPENA